MDHIIFKSNVYSSLFHSTQKGEIRDSHSCRFGQWYKNEATQVFGKAPSFKTIEKYHDDIHIYAKQNLDFIQPQDTVMQNKAKVFENLTKMEEASDRMFELMNQILEETQTKEA
jgi:methyl-accepting chemotaxis protein